MMLPTSPMTPATADGRPSPGPRPGRAGPGLEPGRPLPGRRTAQDRRPTSTARPRRDGARARRYKGQLADARGDGLGACSSATRRSRRRSAASDSTPSSCSPPTATTRRSAASSSRCRSGSTTITTHAPVLHARAQPARRRRTSPSSSRPRPALARITALAARRPRLPPAPARRRDREAAAREVRRRPRRLGPPVRRDHGRPALPARRQGPDQRRGASTSSPTQDRSRARGGRDIDRGDVLGKNVRLFALVTNTLAKDKEIEDRWRNYARPISSRNLANFVEDEVVDALICAVRAAYPRLSHRYYALKAKWFGVDRLALLGPQRAAARGQRRPHVPWREASDVVLDAYAASRRRWPTIGQRFFDEPLDRRGSCGPASRRAPSAHPTVPCAHPYLLLNYQGRAARRHDAGARAGPRRPPGAGGAAGHADGRHAADAGRDRLGLRRDADLPGAARRREHDPAGAASCSPARSRTC